MKGIIKTNHWYPRKFNSDAITLYPYVYCAMEQPSLKLLRHEYDHWENCHKQVLKRGKWFGVATFYGKYLAEYFVELIQFGDHWKAYSNNSNEEEAFHDQDDVNNPEFIKWLKATEYYKRLPFYERERLVG